MVLDYLKSAIIPEIIKGGMGMTTVATFSKQALLFALFLKISEYIKTPSYERMIYRTVLLWLGGNVKEKYV